MKKSVLLIVFIIALAFTAVPVSAAAEDDLYSSISGEIDDALIGSGLDITTEDAAAFDLQDILDTAKDSLSERITAPLRMLAVMLGTVIFTSFLRTSGTDSGIYDMVCGISAAAAVLPTLTAVYEDSFTAVSRTGGFISVYVPVFAGLTAAVGALASAGTYNVFLLFISELFVSTADKLIMPVITVITALAVTGSVFSDISLEKLSEALKKVILRLMTSAMTLFTGFVTMKCTIAAKAEGAASKTVKMAVSGAVPIVGGAVSDAFSTVCGSFDVIRCSVGAAGTYAVILIMLPPLLEIVVFRITMWLASAAAELFSASAAAKLLSALDSGLAIAQSLLVCYMVMFVLCTGVLLSCCGE